MGFYTYSEAKCKLWEPLLYITGDGEELSEWRIIANLALHDDKHSGSSEAKLSLGIKMIFSLFLEALCLPEWRFQISRVKSEILRRHKAQLFLDLIIWYHCAADASSIKFMFRSSFATRGLNQNLFSHPCKSLPSSRSSRLLLCAACHHWHISRIFSYF